MKEKRFYRGLSWLLVLNALVKPVWIFGIDRQVQLQTGHETYGTYFALFSFSYVLSFAADAGLTNLLNRQLATGAGSLDLRQLLRVKGGLLGVYLLLCAAGGWLTGIPDWSVYLPVVGIQALTSLLLFARNTLTALQRFSTDALLSVLDKSLMIGSCGLLLYLPGLFGPITLGRFLNLQLAAMGIAVGVAFYLIYRQRIPPGQLLSRRRLLRMTLPFASIVLLMAAHYRLDGFLLERLAGAYEAGIYASAFRLLDAANIAGYLMASFLVPFITRHRQERALVGRAVLSVQHLLLFAATGVVCFSFAFAPWILELLYHTDDPYPVRVLPLCLAALPGHYLVHVYGSVLTARASFRPFIRILAACAGLNLALNLWLIPSIGAAGAAIAALASQSACGLACAYAASGPEGRWAVLRSALPYAGTAALLLLLFRLGDRTGIPVWLILVAAATLTTGLLGFHLIKKRFVTLP